MSLAGFDARPAPQTEGRQDAAAVARRLTGSVSVEQFNREIRERRFAHFAQTLHPTEMTAIYDVARFDALLARAVVPPHHVDIYSGNDLMKLSDMQHKSARNGTSLITERLRQGATVRVRELQMFDTSVAALTSEVQRVFDARSQVNLYLTPPSAAGFPPHFDITDVFVLQCSGTKSWTVFEQYADQKPLPLAETLWEPERYTPEGRGTTLTLGAGDVLYLPRGTMHAAACLGRASLHLTISLTPLTVADVMVAEVKRFAESHVELRERAVWSERGGAAALTAELRRQFLALASTTDACAAVEAERRVLHGDGETSDSAGALISCLQDLEGRPPAKS